MGKKEMATEILMSYFIVVTLINIVMAVLGLLLEKDRMFGYEAFFFPLIYGFLGSLPSLISYSKKELSITQMGIRKVLQYIILEVVILSFLILNGVNNRIIIVCVGLSVFMVAGFAELFLWFFNYEKAKKLNQLLKSYQEK